MWSRSCGQPDARGGRRGAGFIQALEEGMKRLALVLTVLLTGCWVIPRDVTEAERLCEPYGGWSSIVDTAGSGVKVHCVSGPSFSFTAPAEATQ